MDFILYFVKIIVILQIFLIISLIIFEYVVKSHYFSRENRQHKRNSEMKDILIVLAQHSPPSIDENTAKYFSRFISSLLSVIPAFRETYLAPQTELMQQLIEQILKPSARRLAPSIHWFNRYLAVNCFYYGFDTIDEPILIHLIEDKTLLVSLNAAHIGFNHPNPQIINKIIDHYAEKRHLQQSSFIETITNEMPEVSTIISNRLLNEHDVYVKIFCYRLLTKLPTDHQIISTAEQDIMSPHKELKIATLNYLGQFHQPETIRMIRTHLADTDWETRAITAKLLGKLKDQNAVSLLDNSLKDPKYWVRLNAAQALAEIGNEGIAILKAQDPNVDRFAYEISQEILDSISKRG